MVGQRISSFTTFAIIGLGLVPLAGCVVGQAPGKGQRLHLQEPVTKGWYDLYLPADYVASEAKGITAKRWPLVVTFHGLKPFDDSNGQIHEWQQEADRYGFVVIAPDCKTPSLGVELPLSHILPQVKQDEALTLAALDDVSRRVNVDPTKVLATSWSYGGYLAHYMVNRHPNRFTCLAPRQSNFSSVLLNEQQASQYRNTKIGIFYTENDLDICRRESQEAARWYNRLGFDVTFAVFKNLGHERRPSVAAAFFAEVCGVTAKTPPTELARMQLKPVALPELSGTLLASNSPRSIAPRPGRPHRPGQSREVASAGPGGTNGTSIAPTNRATHTQLPRKRPQRRRHAPAPLNVKPVQPARNASIPTPSRNRRGKGSEASVSPLRVRVSSSIGIAPLLVSFSALAPGHLRRGAYFLWTVDGEPISNGINGQKYLSTPGKHTLDVLMTTADGKEFHATKKVTVLKRMKDGG